MYCQQLTVTRRAGSTITAQPLLCKCWSCEVCRDILRRKVIRRAIVGQPTTLLTLTTNPRAHSDPDTAAQDLKDAFITLVRRIRRHHPNAPIQYMAVFERTKAGWPHLHVLMRAPFIPQKFISDHMKAHISAPIVDIRSVKSKTQVARYVGKYLSKDPHKFEGCQRYWSSRSWRTDKEQQAAEREARTGWLLFEWTVGTYAHLLHQMGWWIEWDRSEEAVRGFLAWKDPPEVPAPI